MIVKSMLMRRLFHSNTEGTDVAVDACTGRGCFERTVAYKAPIRQLIALTALSEKCHQTFGWDVRKTDFPLVDAIKIQENPIEPKKTQSIPVDTSKPSQDSH